VAFAINKESYTGTIREITIGKGDRAFSVGGDAAYPFYTFEGEMPNRPVIAMEIWDMEPTDWPEAARAPFADVLGDPAAWAKKCVEEYGAQAIVLQLKSIDPNDQDATPEAAAETVKKVLAAIDVPLIVWGCATPAKDEEVMKAVSEACQNENLLLGPVEEKNYKGIAAAAMGYGHSLISSSPIDVNLAKQINILLENFGMPMDRIVVDPTTGGLGYGMEYSYSVMERLTMAALSQGDDKLQYPMINNLGNEVWKCKEAKQTVEEAPTLGDPERRAILMEAVGAATYLLAGSNILIMRHPESIRLVKSYIKALYEGGALADVAPISKRLAEVSVDFAALAPALDLSIEEEAKAAPAAKAEPAAPVAPAAPQAEEKPAAAAAVPEQPAPAPQPAAPAAPEVDAQAEAEAAVKAKAEAEAKVKAEAEAKAKAEAEAKAKAEAAAKAKAEAEAKAKEEAEKQAAAEARAARDTAEKELRAKRAREKAALAAKRTATPREEKTMTPAAIQKSEQEKMLERLNRFHKRG
jgi:acetyl-CoA decarbonylase/synthase complex subunit delta